MHDGLNLELHTSVIRDHITMKLKLNPKSSRV